jgi:hypothetical protein
VHAERTPAIPRADVLAGLSILAELVAVDRALLHVAAVLLPLDEGHVEGEQIAEELRRADPDPAVERESAVRMVPPVPHVPDEEDGTVARLRAEGTGGERECGDGRGQRAYDHHASSRVRPSLRGIRASW